METYKVVLGLKGSSQPIEYDAVGLYIKEAYTCVTFLKDGRQLIHKYPTADVFRIEEEYKYIPRRSVRVNDAR